MESESRRESKPRLGGRSARVREDVLTAAFDELAEKGYNGLSMDNVARRSGVHKTTVYRRWPTRDALIVDALDSRSDRNSPVPDTGLLRSDLQEFGEGVQAKLTAAPGKAMLKALVTAVDQSPEIVEKVQRFWRERLDVGAELVARWIDRGALPVGTDPDLLSEALLAPIYLHVLLTEQPLTRERFQDFVDLVLQGVAPVRT